MAKKPGSQGVSFRSLRRKKRDTNGIWGHLANENSFDIGTGSRFGLPSWLLPTVAVASIATMVALCFQVFDLENHKFDGNSVVAKARSATFQVDCGKWAGTGVGINVPVPDGYKTAVFSAAHIFDECAAGDSVNVTSSGRTYAGVLYKKDPVGAVDPNALETESDIALIYLRAKLPSLDSAPDAKVGDWVVELGNPLDQINYASFGIISKVTDSEYFTDAASNHGNSGGPLLDSQARVLGIVSWNALIPENQVDSQNQSTVRDWVNGIAVAKRLNNACALVYSASPRCPFSN